MAGIVSSLVFSSVLVVGEQAAAQAPAPVPAPPDAVDAGTVAADVPVASLDASIPALDAAMPTLPAEPVPPAAPVGSDAGAPAPEPDAATDEPEEAEVELGQITVTARHRVENVHDVPIAVTSVTSRDLAASGNFTLRQVQNQVPSLQILGFNPRNVTIQIRGLGTTAGTVNSGIEPGVGVYVNGVFYARPAVAVFDLFDIESIDVLRGPQGTLFGKNTVAGAIDIRTNEASSASRHSCSSVG